MMHGTMRHDGNGGGAAPRLRLSGSGRAWASGRLVLSCLGTEFRNSLPQCIRLIDKTRLVLSINVTINLLHCGNEFRNSVPVRALGLRATSD